MDAAVEAVSHSFVEMDAMIDEMHALFDAWNEDGAFFPPLDPMALDRARLALHEWLANLVQHAEFNGHPPEVRLRCRVEAGRLHFAIEDNSAGYDIEDRPNATRDLLKVFPERGMGLGFIEAATEELSYCRLEDGRHLMQFYVAPSPSHD